MLNQEVLNALCNPGNSVITPGIKNIQNVLMKINNPQNCYQVIHITGSNGKGSTAEFINSGLCYAGYRVGKYTSPHIKDINEAIQLDSQSISDQDLEFHFYRIKEILDKFSYTLSPFEYLTTIMFDYFRSSGIDYLVLEVGMGGIDDATNVVEPLLSIITNISLEHTKFLGNSLAEIAFAKCGIIKNAPVVIADRQIELINQVRAKTNNYINVLDKYIIKDVTLNYDDFTTDVTFIDNSSNNITGLLHKYKLGLFGRYQVYNFLCAYEVFSYLGIDATCINYAAKHTHNRGRFEVITKDPLLIFDASHNLAGITELVAILNNHFSKDETILVVSVLKDKDVVEIFKQLSQITNCVICTTVPNNPRSMGIQDLEFIANKSISKVVGVPNPNDALDYAKSYKKSLTLVTGSIYLLAALDKAMW